MTRVATFAVQQLALSNTLASQSRTQDLQIQVSSDQTSRTYSGIASQSRTLINFETIREQSLTFTQNIETADRRLEVMEASTAQLFDVASDLRTLLLTALSGDNAENLALQQQAQSMLEQTVDLLNTDLDGRFLFSGTRTDTAAINLDDLLNPQAPLVDTIEFTGGATTSGTGLFSIPGIVSLRVPSGSAGDAFQLTYDGAGTLTLTNRASGASANATVSAPPVAGGSADYTFSIAGTDVVLTIDDQFNMATPITTQPITGTVAGGTGAFGTITLNQTLGDISKITSNTVDIASPTNDASNITLTLPSADGNFVATGVDFETAPGPQNVVLTNATTGAEITLTVNVTTVLADATANDPGTEIDLGNLLVNLAATAGATSFAAAVPGEIGYDPSDPAYYQGDSVKLAVRADENITVDYGVTAAAGGFEKLIRAVFVTMEASQPGAVNLDDLENALSFVTAAIDEIPNIRSEIGSSRATLENLMTSHGDTILLADRTIGEIEKPDLAEAATLLAQNATQIEASFATLSRLNQLSLIEFI